MISQLWSTGKKLDRSVVQFELFYTSTTLQIDMVDEKQVVCDEGVANNRVDDHAAIAEKYDLELVAGSFFYTTYTDATNPILCDVSKCMGFPLPLPVPGINDGPECKAQEAS